MTISRLTTYSPAVLQKKYFFYMTHDESWYQNFELLKAYIEEHHHLPDKKKVENRGLLSWAKYQRKRIKIGALDDKKVRLFEELMDSRSKEHTGGKRKKENMQLMIDYEDR